MATTPTRIYTVKTKHDGKVIAQRLVRAPNQAQAIRHVATESITAEVATQDECIDLAAAGVKVEVSGEKPATDEVLHVGGDPAPSTPSTEESKQ